MKSEIRHLQQMKSPNAYPTISANYRSFRTMDNQVNCRQCNRVENFTLACQTNVMPTKEPTLYQNHRPAYVPHDTFRYLQSLHILNHNSLQNKWQKAWHYYIIADKIPSILFPCGNHNSCLLIRPTISIKLDLISQVNTKVIVTWSKNLLYRTNIALYQAT